MLYRRVHGECLVDLVLMAIDDDPSAKMMSLSNNHRRVVAVVLTITCPFSLLLLAIKRGN